MGSVSLRQLPRSPLWDAPHGVPQRFNSKPERSSAWGMLSASQQQRVAAVRIRVEADVDHHRGSERERTRVAPACREQDRG